MWFLELVQSVGSDLLFLQQRAFFGALGRSVMPAHSVWRFSVVEDSCYHYHGTTTNTYFPHQLNTGT